MEKKNNVEIRVVTEGCGNTKFIAPNGAVMGRVMPGRPGRYDAMFSPYFHGHDLRLPDAVESLSSAVERYFTQYGVSVDFITEK